MYMKNKRVHVFYFYAGLELQDLCPFCDLVILYSNNLVNKISEEPDIRHTLTDQDVDADVNLWLNYSPFFDFGILST